MSGTTIHTILQCFVDINLETDENSTYSLDLLDVSLAQETYNIDEGQYVDITVSLNSPSINGYEEVEVGVVANNTSLLDFDMLGETYPRTLIFSAGQQSNTIRFLANSDLFEEGTESFDVILGFFTNVNPGAIITSTVNIIDLTNLKEVFINSQGGYLWTNPLYPNDAPELRFSSSEGTVKEITISLDSPSVFGIEGITVQLTNGTANSSDYSVIGSTILTWSISEQHKTIQINALSDQLIESDETISIDLVNPINTNIISPYHSVFTIVDMSPDTRYIQVNFQGLYTQIGGFNFQNITTLRNIINNEEISNGSGDETMLLKFGESFVSIIDDLDNGPTSINGSNCIRTNVTDFFGGTTGYNDRVFFGKNPSTGAYGDVKLKVISRGQHPVIIGGNQINNNDYVIFNVDAFDYKLTLPANDVLLPAGTFIGSTILPANTITEALYEFVIITNYAERQFVLKGLNNSISTNKEINFGVHRFEETYSSLDAILVTNTHNLVTTYNKVLANWDNYPFYNSPKACLPLGEYISSPYRSFPSNDNQTISAQINGFAILSENSKYYSNGVGDGPSTYEESKYVSVEFLPSGQTVGITCSPITYPGTTNNTAWTSLAFKIVP